MHNNISIPILKPNFKQTVSEKHIIQDTPASDTPKNNKKNHRTAYSITSAAIASFVIGGLIYRHNRRKKIIADLEKMSREFEEAQKKEFEKSMKDLEEWKKIFDKIDKEFEETRKKYDMTFFKNTSYKTYDWEAEYKKMYEEMHNWEKEFKEKNRQFYENLNTMKEDFKKSSQKTKKAYEDMREKIRRENETFKRTTSQKTKEHSNRDFFKEFSEAQIKEIDELVKKSLSKEELNNYKELLAKLLKTSPENIKKLHNGDKKVYRELVLKVHPDRNPDDKLANFRFVVVDKLYKMNKS